mmetsp:Transcript_6682/g.21888  ORF Transcript_6682/g.21888 Transcript_6682/m.21888 type:complete len:204 (+) Transcript_6682:964-1575(+)
MGGRRALYGAAPGRARSHSPTHTANGNHHHSHTDLQGWGEEACGHCLVLAPSPSAAGPYNKRALQRAPRNGGRLYMASMVRVLCALPETRAAGPLRSHGALKLIEIGGARGRCGDRGGLGHRECVAATVLRDCRQWGLELASKSSSPLPRPAGASRALLSSCPTLSTRGWPWCLRFRQQVRGERERHVGTRRRTGPLRRRVRK